MPIGKETIINAINDSIIKTNTEKENPFNTTVGQEVVSISEEARARAIREGTLKIITYTQTNPTGGVFGTVYTPTVGYKGEVQKIIISTNCAETKKIRLRTLQGITGEGTKDTLFAINSNTPLIWDIPITIGQTGSISYVSDEAFTGALHLTAVLVEKPL